MKKAKKLKILDLDEINNIDDIMVYISFRSEVHTDNLINELLNKGKNILAPYCIVDERRMEIAPISNLSDDLEFGAYNIPEPKDQLKEKEFSPTQLDLVIVPAVAFSINGYRIGYGGGYYDRFLERLTADTMTIGITYDDLLFEELPQEDHDLPVDMVVTERKVVKSNN